MDTWSYSFWESIVQIGILVTALLIGNTLRRKVPFISRSLLPSSVVGGLLVLLCKLIPGVEQYINNSFMEGVAYHCLALGFIALALKENNFKKTERRAPVVIKTGALVVSTYMVQGFVGLAITAGLSLVLPQVMPASGLLMMLGFGQGPGQALNFGGVYEDAGFVGGRSFGLTLVAIGFLVACIVGVLFLNVLKRQGKLKDVSEKKKDTFSTSEEISNPNDIPLSESVDKLTVNIAIVVMAYFFTYLFMAGITYFLDKGYLGNFGINTVKPLIWGFNFLFGTLFAILFKVCMKGFKKAKIMTRNYTSNFMLNRISGTVFDLMILAGVAAIEFEHVANLWLPIVLLSVAGTVVTFVYLNIMCKRLYPEYRYEAMSSLFGMLTGTASTGVILLREIDPLFETPASNNLVLQTVPAMCFGFPILLLVGYAKGGLTEVLITMGIVLVLLAVFNVALLMKRKGKPAPKQNDEAAE